jgi:hypothetical protein
MASIDSGQVVHQLIGLKARLADGDVEIACAIDTVLDTPLA